MLILERCLDLLEGTRAEREALDLRDLEAIRPLLPTSHTNINKVLDSWEEGAITAREAVTKVIDLLACQRDADDIGERRKAEFPPSLEYIDL